MIDKIIHLITNLDLPIFESVVTAFPEPTINNYDEIVEFLTNRHSMQDKFLNRLEFLNVGFSGSYDEFASQLQTLFESFDKTQLREQLLVAKFLSAIPKSISTELRIRRPKDLSDCVKIAQSLQSSSTSLVTAAMSRTSKKTPTIAKAFTKPNSSETRKCFRCGSKDHLANDSVCRARHATCLNCRKIGHFKSVCTARSNDQRTNQKNFHLNMTHYSDSHGRVCKPYVTLTVCCNDGHSFRQKFLLDTGSDVSILPKSTFTNFFKLN